MPCGLLSPELLSLWNVQFREVNLYCGNETAIGVDEVPEWRDWTERETTPDQSRIEAYLAGSLAGNERILHVGLGNSRFAQTFSPLVSSIVGISITKNEVETAISKRIHNYFPILMNKYSSALKESFSREFDVIIDNNPSSFSCCMLHLARMLETYSKILKKDGRIVTDIVGLNFVSSTPEANHRWKFDFQDWQAITKVFGLVASPFDEYIIVTKCMSTSDV